MNYNTPTFVSPKKDNSTVYASTVSSNNTFTTIKVQLLSFYFLDEVIIEQAYKVLLSMAFEPA